MSSLELNFVLISINTLTFMSCYSSSILNASDKHHKDIQSASPGNGMVTKDYCQTEYFNATCPKDHVIIMAAARYGRMHKGRCVTGSYGAIGCAVDAYGYIHMKCSGRAQCLLHTMDPGLHKSEPCPKDLAAFLEASYQCVKVTKGNKETCKHGFIPIFEQNQGYLSSATVTQEFELGTVDCPWRIQAYPGQRIRLTQVAFAGLNSEEESPGRESSASPDVCYEVGFVREDTIGSGSSSTMRPGGYGSGSDPGSPLKACAAVDKFQGRGRNGSVLMYLSQGFSVTLRFHTKQVLHSLSPVIVRFEVEGCRDMVAPAGGWIRVEHDHVTLGCNNMDDVWSLRCVVNDWEGLTPNCTAPSSTWRDTRTADGTTETLPLGILMVVAIGVALGVFFGGALLSVVSLVLKRRSRSNQSESATYTTSNIIDIDPQYDSSITYPRHLVHCTYHNGSLPVGHCKSHVFRDSEAFPDHQRHHFSHHHHPVLGSEESTEEMLKQGTGGLREVYDSPCATGKMSDIHHNLLPIHQYQSVQLA